MAPRSVATLSGRSASDVERTLRDQPGTDLDYDGRVVGFGLTLRPAAHRFIDSGRTLYTVCVTDALVYPARLGESAVTESNCPAIGQAIRIAMTPDAVPSVDPDGAVISRLLDPPLSWRCQRSGLRQGGSSLRPRRHANGRARSPKAVS